MSIYFVSAVNLADRRGLPFDLRELKALLRAGTRTLVEGDAAAHSQVPGGGR